MTEREEDGTESVLCTVEAHRVWYGSKPERLSVCMCMCMCVCVGGGQ